MAQIVDLNELVPQDITLRYGSPPVDYVFPGDIGTATVFRLFEMRQALAAIEGKDPAEIVASMKQKFGDIDKELLALFRLRNPKMTELPFGIRSTGAILAIVLGQLGLTVTEENPPKPASKPKRATSVRTRK